MASARAEAEELRSRARAVLADAQAEVNLLNARRDAIVRELTGVSGVIEALAVDSSPRPSIREFLLPSRSRLPHGHGPAASRPAKALIPNHRPLTQRVDDMSNRRQMSFRSTDRAESPVEIDPEIEDLRAQANDAVADASWLGAQVEQLTVALNEARRDAVNASTTNVAAGPPTFADLGEHVGQILTIAEREANHIRSAAVAEAERAQVDFKASGRRRPARSRCLRSQYPGGGRHSGGSDPRRRASSGQRIDRRRPPPLECVA